jgi:hypothetical protein
MSLSAQNSLTIRRLRNGDSLYMSFNVTGILYQGVDTDTGSVKPSWEDAANQPVITPIVSSMRGNGVSLSMFSWKYLGASLSFTGSSSGDWVTDSTGKFQMNVTTGALKIIKDLASATNVANDTLEFSCVATVAGMEYTITKSIDVVIQSVGASSYVGLITASTTQLSATTTTATLKAVLMLSGVETSCYVKWLKGSTAWKDKTSSMTVSVTRDDVSGSQLFICEFYAAEADTLPVFRAGINIIDTLDDYIINLTVTSTNKEVDTGKPVTVTGTLVNARTGETVTPSSPTWSLQVMDKDTWEVLKESATNTIEVTTTETDRNGVENDVEVVGQVTW